MRDELRRALAQIVGVAGVGSDSVVRASNVTQVREVLLACSALGASVAPLMSGVSSDVDVLVSVDRLDAIRLDAPALLLRAGAASTWTAIREAAGAGRLAVVGVGSLRHERAGQSVAMGEISHRALAGVDFMTPQGELISAGGRTLKDVVGYDLPGLVLGSEEQLGLILAVTLRLEPVAARTAAQPGPGPWRGDAGIDLVGSLLS